MDIIIAFDTETTGLSPATEHVVQMASVTCRASGEMISTFDMLANPGKPIHPKAVETHGITDAMVAKEPSSQEVVSYWAKYVSGASEGNNVYLAGHNVKRYDIPLLRKYFPKWLELPVLDTLAMARAISPNAPNHKLSYLVGEFYGLNPELAKNAHDGLADCKMVVELLLYYLKLDTRPLAELVAHYNAPRTLTTMPFGKYKGCLFSALKSSYLRWMVDQPDMDPDVVHTAKQHLARRV